MDDVLADFLAESSENLALLERDLIALEKVPGDDALLARIFRVFHSLKGTCGFLNLPRLEKIAHGGETLLDRFRSHERAIDDAAISLMLDLTDRIKTILTALGDDGTEPSGDDAGLLNAMADFGSSHKTVPGKRPAESMPCSPQDTVRVAVATLDHMMDMVSEMVLTRNQMQALKGDSSLLQRLSGAIADMQDSVTRTRMQPIDRLWRQMPRLVRDLARDLGKEIDITLSGNDTELDRQVLEKIHDPLLHLLRNAAGHGIEKPEERIALRKKRKGAIALRAGHDSGHVVITVADDGRGLDPESIRRRAVEKHLCQAEDDLGDAAMRDLIFTPGFSTADSVTSVSGRGVGLDVVRSNIESIGGTIDIDSIPGQGMTVTLNIPLTLAIVPALLVAAGGQRFALPQRHVRELLRLDRIDPVLRWRHYLLPLLPLAQTLALADPSSPRYAAVVQTGTRLFAIALDHIAHVQDIVVRPLSPALQDIKFFAGQTVLGDGAAILILEPNGLARMLGDKHPRHDAREEEIAAPQATSRYLLFRAGSGAAKAVPLDAVLRLEKVSPAALDMSDGRYLLPVADGILDVIDLQSGAQRGAAPLLILQSGTGKIGLLVDDILDIAEKEESAITRTSIPHLQGRAVFRGHAADIVDPAHYIGGL